MGAPGGRPAMSRLADSGGHKGRPYSETDDGFLGRDRTDGLEDWAALGVDAAQPNVGAQLAPGVADQAPHDAHATFELDHRHRVRRFLGIACGGNVDGRPNDDPTNTRDLVRLEVGTPTPRAGITAHRDGLPVEATAIDRQPRRISHGPGCEPWPPRRSHPCCGPGRSGRRRPDWRPRRATAALDRRPARHRWRPPGGPWR